MLALDFGSDSNGSPAPIDLDLTPEAKSEWVAFYNSHNEKQETLVGPLASAYSKLEGGRRGWPRCSISPGAPAGAAAGGAIDAESMGAGIAGPVVLL